VANLAATFFSICSNFFPPPLSCPIVLTIQYSPAQTAAYLSESESESESYVTTDGQPASLSWSKAPIWGLRPDLYYMYDNYGLVLVGGALSDERSGLSFVYAAQSFSGPSPLGLETIFYCLTFETSLFVASYDSQVHGGGIRPRLHTGLFTAVLKSTLKKHQSKKPRTFPDILPSRFVS
jgi:hypothetical protein